jgi:hypothetical protein
MDFAPDQLFFLQYSLTAIMFSLYTVRKMFGPYIL